METIRLGDFVDADAAAGLRARAGASILQECDDVARARVAEKLSELFLVPADAMTFDQGEKVGRRVAGEGGAAELQVGGEVIVRRGAQVGEIAASAAGDGDLFSDTIVMLQDEHAAAGAGGGHRAEQSRRAPAEDDDIMVLHGGGAYSACSGRG